MSYQFCVNEWRNAVNRFGAKTALTYDSILPAVLVKPYGIRYAIGKMVNRLWQKIYCTPGELTEVNCGPRRTIAHTISVNLGTR